jgi:predicted TIM-barrel fold metal-dependent hydrolase
MRIIDARVRLPLELRPPEQQNLPSGFMAQYDEVLDLQAKRARSFTELQDEMDANGVDHAVVHVEYETGDGVDEMNEAVARIVADDPARFSGFGSVSLHEQDIMRSVKQVRRVADMGLRGLNIQPAFLGYETDSRALYPIYSTACELGLVVGIHSGVNYARTVPMDREHPRRIDQVASDFPDLSLVACHASWPWVDEIVAVARRHPSVYLEFGGMSPRYVDEPGTGWATLRRMMDNLLRDQVLFATDWPIMTIDRAVDEWRRMDLKDQTIEQLLGGNAARLLDLTGAEVGDA